MDIRQNPTCVFCFSIRFMDCWHSAKFSLLMRKYVGLLIASIVFFAFSADVQKKMVYQNDYTIECFVTLKDINSFHPKKTYWWYKTGEIHYSLSSAGGQVLHGDYTKFYRSHQMAEKGVFDNGLKVGVWKQWHENGGLQQYEVWENGFKNGRFLTFDPNGTIMIEGSYRNNLKSDRWIDHRTKDTTYHKNMEVFEEKPKTTVGKIVDKVFKKQDSLEKVQAKQERLIKRRNDSIARAKKKQERLMKRHHDSIQNALKKQKKQAVIKNAQ